MQRETWAVRHSLLARRKVLVDPDNGGLGGVRGEPARKRQKKARGRRRIAGIGRQDLGERAKLKAAAKETIQAAGAAEGQMRYFM